MSQRVPEVPAALQSRAGPSAVVCAGRPVSLFPFRPGVINPVPGPEPYRGARGPVDVESDDLLLLMLRCRTLQTRDPSKAAICHASDGPLMYALIEDTKVHEEVVRLMLEANVRQNGHEHPQKRDHSYQLVHTLVRD